MEPVQSGCTFSSSSFDFCADNQLGEAGNLSWAIHHRQISTNVAHTPNQNQTELLFEFIPAFSDGALRSDALPLPVLNTHIQPETAVCESSGPGREGGRDEPVTQFNTLVFHRFGPGNNKALCCLHPGWEQIPALTHIRAERKSSRGPLVTPPSVLTCGAITRKRDPGAGERRPRDPSAADLQCRSYRKHKAGD